MLVLMKPNSSAADLTRVRELLDEMGLENSVLGIARQPVIEVLDRAGGELRLRLEKLPTIQRILDGPEPLLSASRQPGDATREIPLGPSATVGGTKLAVIAGPCSVESEDQLMTAAYAARAAGAVGLRGGAFKPRTSPYSFQGLGEPGLELLARAREATGLAIVTEVMSPDQVELVAGYADVLQVGSRNMHDSQLLQAVGRQSKPVLLKRGWSATLDEFLMAAEYIMQAGNENVILCERGIRTFERFTRNTLSLSVVPAVKACSQLPIIVDPSHGTGRADLVLPMSRAAIAAGADGLLIEMHPDPQRAWSDGDQTVDPAELTRLMEGLPALARACGRSL